MIIVFKPYITQALIMLFWKKYTPTFYTWYLLHVSILQALIFKLRGVSVEEELGPDESWISPVDVNLVKNESAEYFNVNRKLLFYALLELKASS